MLNKKWRAVFWGSLILLLGKVYGEGGEWRLPCHDGAVVGIRFLSDGKRMVSVGEDQTIQVREAGEGKLLTKYKETAGSIKAMAVSRDNQSVAFGCENNKVRIWSLDAQTCLHTFSPEGNGSKTSFLSVEFSQDGERVAAGREDGTVHWWHLKTGRHMKAPAGKNYLPGFDAHKSPVTAVAFVHGGKWLVSGEVGLDLAPLIIWDVETGKIVHRLYVPGKGIYAVEYIPTVSSLIVLTWRGELLKYRLPGKPVDVEGSWEDAEIGRYKPEKLDRLLVARELLGQETLVPDLQKTYQLLDVDKTGRFMALGFRESAALWVEDESTDDAQLSIFPFSKEWHSKSATRSIAISPDGHTVLMGQENGVIQKKRWPDRERILLRGLNWLLRNQNPDGGWSADKHAMAVTGLAMLAFTGFGHTHLYGEFKEYAEVLRKAVRYIKKRIEEVDNKRNLLDHAIATMAMAELLVLSGDSGGMKACVEQAVKHCLLTQNADGGWGNTPGDQTSNTFVTSWMVLTLKTTMSCVVLRYVADPSKEMIEEAYQRALKWYDSVTDEKTGLVRYAERMEGDPDNSAKDLSRDYFVDKVPIWTAMGVLCRLFMRQPRDHEAVKKGVDQLITYIPDRTDKNSTAVQPANLMHLFFGSFASFQIGGKTWTKWNEYMQETVAQLQISTKGGAEKESNTGSWDPRGFWCRDEGRAAATALSILSLEVYYRYERAQEGAGY